MQRASTQEQPFSDFQHFSHFDSEHWSKVRAERARLGLASCPQRGALVPDHPLAGAQLVERATGKVFCVQSIRKDWYRGWFLVALIEHNGSHGLCVVESLTCTDPGLLKALEDFTQRFSRLQ